MQKASASFRFAAVCFLLGATIGCGGGDKGKGSVSGKVTLDGAPLQSGTISFAPADGGSASAETLIQNGEYHLEVPPGEKTVIIQGFKEGPPGPDGVTSNVPILPPKYNSRSELKETVTDDNHEFDYPLTSS
jgi:hypothetical protein